MNRTTWGVLLSVTSAVFLAGCGATSTSAAATHKPKPTTIRITDDAHHTITLKKPARRIVTLEPSNAEIALDLGLKSEMVGTDQSTMAYTPSPWKQELKGIPSIGPSYPAINVEQVVAAKPDLVIASVGIKGVASLARYHIPVLTLQPTSIQGMYHDIRLVGQATGRTSQAKQLVNHLKSQVASIEDQLKGVPKPTVFYDLGGLYTAGPGSFLNSLINLADAKNVGASMAKQPWPQVQAEQVVHADPDVILIDGSSGTSVKKEEATAGFSAIKAVRAGHVYEVTQPSYVDAPSPALVMGLNELVKILHPGLKVTS